MAKFARLDGANTVIELFEHPTLKPSDTHIAAIAAQFVPCPDTVVGGAKKSGNSWTNPTVAADAQILPLLAPMAFYMAFKPAERIAIKASTDAMVVEFWATYEMAKELDNSIDPNLPSMSESLGHLVGAGILSSAARVQEIRLGVPQ
jgi:hypothetical protein